MQNSAKYPFGRVQFYDAKDLLKPTELTNGGRRLYSESDLKRMRMICLLKSLGLSLESIKGILDSDHPENVLLLLLDEQERQIDEEIGLMQRQKKAIGGVRETLRTGQTFSIESIADMEHMMEEKKKLRRLRGTMLLLAIPMTLIEWGTIFLLDIHRHMVGRLLRAFRLSRFLVSLSCGCITKTRFTSARNAANAFDRH